MRFIVICVTLIGFEIGLFGQIPDTVRLSEVEILKNRTSVFSDNTQHQVLSVQKMRNSTQTSLGEFLQSQGGFYVAANGGGGALATIRLRGASSNHTQVNWNGFPINSSTTGGADLSIIPLDGFNNVSVVYGASGALYGSGSIGGAINLDTKIKSSDSAYFRNSFSYSNEGTYQVRFSNQSSIGKLKFQISQWYVTSENRYKYYLDKTQIGIRKNADYFNYGVIASLLYPINSASDLEGALWVQAKKYRVPTILGSSDNSFDFQFDEAIRGTFGYTYRFNNSVLKAKIAYFNDNLLFTKKSFEIDTLFLIYSPFSTIRFQGDLTYRYYFNALIIESGIVPTSISAEVGAYNQSRHEQSLALFQCASLRVDRVKLDLAVRKEMAINYSSKLLFSTGASVSIIKDLLQGNINWSQKFRKPTLNELYWRPGGNENLQSETGNSLEFGLNLNKKFNHFAELNIELNGYESKIENLILWIPNSLSGIWEPKNRDNAFVRGVSLKGDLGLKINSSNISLGGTLDFNKNIVRSNNQPWEDMLYNPKMSCSGTANYSNSLIDATLNLLYFGSRRYDSKIVELLHPYYTLNFAISARFAISKVHMQSGVQVSNILNENYQLVKSYPMPLRTIGVMLSVKI